MMNWGYGPFSPGGGWLMMGGGILIQLLFWGIIIYVLVRLLNGSKLGGGAGKVEIGGDQRAEEIIKQRFARGEITKEQYKEMLSTLKE